MRSPKMGHKSISLTRDKTLTRDKITLSQLESFLFKSSSQPSRSDIQQVNDRISDLFKANGHPSAPALSRNSADSVPTIPFPCRRRSFHRTALAKPEEIVGTASLLLGAPADKLIQSLSYSHLE